MPKKKDVSLTEKVKKDFLNSTEELQRQKSTSHCHLEKELSMLRVTMDSRMVDLQELQDLADRTKPAAHMLENVMSELEQNKVELTSLYKSSEKNRGDMEVLLNEQNTELINLRTNALVIETLEDEVGELNVKNDDLSKRVKEMEQVVHMSQKQEQLLHHRLREKEEEGKNADKEYSLKMLDLVTKISAANEKLVEKDAKIEQTERTVKEIFKKCDHLVANNSDVKNELASCVQSGNHLKDLNIKLQYCKTYLEEQVEHLISEMKIAKANNEKLKLDLANANGERSWNDKQILLLNEEIAGAKQDMALLRKELKNLKKYLKDFESGDARSAVVIKEMRRNRDDCNKIKESLEKKIVDLEAKKEEAEIELKNSAVLEKRLRVKLMEYQSKIEFYVENFIEKQELHKIKNELEIKYKLDVNTQLVKVCAMFEKEQEELADTMKSSLTLRRGMELDDLSPGGMTNSVDFDFRTPSALQLKLNK